MIATIAYVAACTGAGVLLLRLLAGDAWGGLSRSSVPLIASAFAVGQASVAALWIPLGLLGWFDRRVIVVLLIALVLGAAPLARPLLCSFAPHARALRARIAAEGFTVAAVVLTLAIVAGGFGIAAWYTPPIGDAEAFYLVYARIIAARGRLEPMPGLYENFSSIGLMGELHMAALVSLAGVPSAKLFAWCIGLAAAWTLDSICRVAGLGTHGRLIVQVMLFSSSAFTAHLYDGKVDLFAVALALAAVRWALDAPQSAWSAAAIRVAGLATGFAVVAKFSYALAFVPPMVLLVGWRQARALGALGAWAVVAALPHLLKNAVFFGLPFAPFIGGENWADQVWYPPDVTRQIVLTYPLALVFGRYSMQSGNLSFLALALLPMLFWLPRPAQLRESVLWQISAAALLGTLLWLVLRPSIMAPRYLLATLVLFYPSIARGAETMLARETGVRVLRAAVMTALLIAGLAYMPPLREMEQVRRNSANPCIAASEYCPALVYLNAVADAGARVFVAGYYTYWLRDDLLQCRDRGAESRLPRIMKGPGLSWQALMDGGFRWLIVERRSYGAELEGLAKQPMPAGLSAVTVWADATAVVLRLSYNAAGGAPGCARLVGRRWSVVGAR